MALSRLLGELQEDVRDFDRIIAKQDSLHVDYTNLGRWLNDPRSYPVDSLADRNLSTATLGSAAIRWQTLRSAPLSGDSAEVEHLASSLEFIHLTWNLWYRDLLIDFRAHVAEAITMVQDYLPAN